MLEQGRIFSDPLAVKILGEDAGSIAREARQRPDGRMRIFIAARTRFAEDSLASAVEGGARQLVVLGAGLDTYAFRGALRDRLRIFEVDHPATQEWKRQRLAAAEIPIPENLKFSPLDFERATLPDALAASGFDPAEQTFFTWLGVTPYLTEAAIWRTLEFMARLSGGARVVFDYGDPPETLDPELRRDHDLRAARVAELGEKWLTYFEAAPLRRKLIELGFSNVEDLGPAEIAARYFGGRVARARGGHIVLASTEAL